MVDAIVHSGTQHFCMQFPGPGTYTTHVYLVRNAPAPTSCPDSALDMAALRAPGGVAWETDPLRTRY
jgi:hypothetical protein